MIKIGNKAVGQLSQWAKKRGWDVEKTKRRGHLKFTKQGCSTVFASGTPSDQRAILNIRSQLKRAEQGGV